MTDAWRKSGIGAVGDVPWGTHFCHFYENRRDLLDVLVPYFKTGLEQHEFCVWRVFDPLDEQAAADALELALPGSGARLAAGDIEIVPPSQWDRGDGAHDLRQLVRDWETQLNKALSKGYAGMRVNVSAARLAERDSRDLDAYEDEFSGLVADRRIIMLSAYPLEIGTATETPARGYTHRFAIARQCGNWQVVEPPELKRARADVKRLNTELATAEIDRTREAAARDRAEVALRVSDARSLCYFGLGLVGMALVSPTDGCIEVNDRLCAMLGYERRELMRMTWAALSHPDDLAGDMRNYGRIVAQEVEGYRVAKRWIRKNGDVIHTNTSLQCQRRADGSVDYLAAMIEEVTVLGQPLSEGRATSGAAGPSPRALSGREREVARLIGLGRTVKETAAALALSEKTVSTYRTRILTKLDLRNTAELIRYAIESRLAQ